MKKLIQKYWEECYEFLEDWEYEAIVNYICENAVPAPVLYRGINIDPDTIDVGDTIDLHDMESFLSMTPDFNHAWDYGNIILKVEGLEGYPITKEDVDGAKILKYTPEWLVINTDIYVEEIEYDKKKDIYIVSCR